MKKLEVKKEDLEYNINFVKERIKKYDREDLDIMAVVKGNGMGLGIVQVSKILVENGIKYLAVATLEEFRILIREKLSAKIMMLTPTTQKNELEELIENNAILTIGSVEEFKTIEKILEEKNLEIDAHIKIDTGFGRYGFIYENINEISICFEKAKRVHITGMYTHFSKPIDEKWTRIQFNRFTEVAQKIVNLGYNSGMLHVSETTAFLKYPDMCLNMVRIGSLFQGRVLVPGLNLKKIGIFKSYINEIKNVPKGYNIGYSNTYKTKKETKIAIVPVRIYGWTK